MIKKGDFIEFDYIGKINPSKQVFDTTLKEEAKKAQIEQGQEFGPKIICVGKEQAIKGIDEALVGKNSGDEFIIDILPENAFGKRNPKMVQLTTLATFKGSKVQPVPGLQLNVGGMLATVRSVNGGRVLLDFNHPLSGRSLNYWVKIHRIVSKPEEKLQALVKLALIQKAEVTFADGKVTLTSNKEIPAAAKEFFEKQAMELISEIKEIVWVVEAKKKSKQHEHDHN